MNDDFWRYFNLKYYGKTWGEYLFDNYDKQISSYEEKNPDFKYKASRELLILLMKQLESK